MARHMTTDDWSNFLSTIDYLIDFVKKHNKNAKDLPPFDIECLLPGKEYPKLLEDFKRDKRRMVFRKYMADNMIEDHWRVLFHWILEYEASLIYLDPPVPQPWPLSIVNFPLFKSSYPSDKFTLDEMILNLLSTKKVVVPGCKGFHPE